jgi:hypothetical protein
MISDIRVGKTGQMAGSSIGSNEAQQACLCECLNCICPLPSFYRTAFANLDMLAWNLIHS